jgi:hypothetical protein
MAKNKRSADAISGQVLIRYLASVTTKERSADKMRINGHPITETMSRALYRWRNERVEPRVGKVEESLHHWGLTFRNFEDWAVENEECVWSNSCPPPWWNDESESRWREDLDSCDPEWRAEAEAYGSAIGEIKPRKQQRATVRMDAEEIKVSRHQERVPVAA